MLLSIIVVTVLVGDGSCSLILQKLPRDGVLECDVDVIASIRDYVRN